MTIALTSRLTPVKRQVSGASTFVAAVLTLFVHAVCAQFGFAQELAVVGSSPVDGAVLVPLQATVSFQFSLPLDTTYRHPGGLPAEFFTISPPDSISIDSAYVSADLTTIFFDVTHRRHTDYLWILTGARSPSDTLLCAPAVLNYSTASTSGQWSVSGEAVGVIALKRNPCNQFPAMTALLYNTLPESGGYPVAAAPAFPDSDYVYTISGVRNGTYWPAVVSDINANGVIEPQLPRLPERDYYRDDQYRPRSIIVSDSDVGGVDMIMLVGLDVESRAPPSAVQTHSYPNPFSASATVAFSTTRSDYVRIELFDVLGRRVKQVADRFFLAGDHRLFISASDLAPGLYVCTVRIGVGGTTGVATLLVAR